MVCLGMERNDIVEQVQVEEVYDAEALEERESVMVAVMTAESEKEEESGEASASDGNGFCYPEGETAYDGYDGSGADDFADWNQNEGRDT